MNKNPFPLPRILSPIKSMLCAFILGPLILSLFYLFSSIYKLPGSDERGLFQFYSATIGDFFVLPLIWFLISKYYQKMLLANVEIKQSPRAQFFSYFIGITSTIFVTLAGVYGPNRDWTLPQFGQINLAGIYHSLFMMFMLGTFWNFCFDYWKVAFANKNENLSVYQELKVASVIYWIILNLATFFFVLLWADNIYSIEKTKSAFFESNKLQQIGWLIFLVINMWLSVQNNLIPKNRLLIWALKQILILLILLIIGMILADPGNIL